MGYNGITRLYLWLTKLCQFKTYLFYPGYRLKAEYNITLRRISHPVALPWLTDVTEKYLPLQYYMAVHADKAQKLSLQ